MEYTTPGFIERARKIHGDKYDYSKCNYVSAITKMPIICPEHGEFIQCYAKHVLTKRGCPKCGIKKCAQSISVTFDDFVKRAREKHGDKFQYIESSYKNMQSKLSLICQTHGEVQMTGNSHHVSKTGCPKCRHVSAAMNKTRPFDEFIRLGKEKHNNKYDYSKVIEYKNRSSKLCIICPIHGEFFQTVENHLAGGCRKCADDLHASKSRKTTDEFIKEAQALWGDTYDYSLVEYKSSNHKIKIICKLHGIFEKITKDHIGSNTQGCQKCKPRKHSKMSIDWLNYMKVQDSVDIQHNENTNNNGEHRIKNSLYHADGYCKETNVIYEFHGSYWHGDPKKYQSDKINTHMNKSFRELYERTLKKMNHCREQGYTVVECWESDWRKACKAVILLQRRFRKNRVN